MRKSVLFSLFIALLICSSFGCKSYNNDENLKKFWEYYNSKIEQFELENEQFKDTKVDAVFLGDSLTDGYDLKKFYPELQPNAQENLYIPPRTLFLKLHARLKLKAKRTTKALKLKTF